MLSEFDLLLIVIGSPLLATLLCAPFVLRASPNKAGTPYGRYVFMGTMGGMGIALIAGIVVESVFYLKNGKQLEISAIGLFVAGALIAGPLISPLVGAIVSLFIRRHRR